MNSQLFVEALSNIELDQVFNPYRHNCTTHDLIDGAEVRRQNLTHFLNVLELIEVDTIWMGRDLGYRGGRRTGIALTDEFHLSEMGTAYPGILTQKATKGPALMERTASEIWNVLTKLSLPPLLWNVFPFHPHDPDNQFTNRKFSKFELESVTDLNVELIRWLKIKRIICIGKDATNYSSKLGIKVECVRHPSYGGVRDFREGMANIYGKDFGKQVAQAPLF